MKNSSSPPLVSGIPARKQSRKLVPDAAGLSGPRWPCAIFRADGSVPRDGLPVLARGDDAPRRAGREPAPAQASVARASADCVTAQIDDRQFLPSAAGSPETTAIVPKRVAATSLVREAAQRAAAAKVSFALYFIDLDHFNDVNDSLGHHAGNEFIRVIAQRLGATAGPTGAVEGVGVGMFILFTHEVQTARTAEHFATRIREALAVPLQIGPSTFNPSACVGIACHPGTNYDVDELAEAAETAMHVARSAGRNEHRIYNPAMRSHIRESLWMQNQLNVALMQRQFHVLYQPKFNAATERMVGMEALLRWNHPERGAIPPLEFIPCAEKTGQIVALGGLILQSACLQARQWLDTGLVWPVAVNLSPRQFGDSHLLEDVREALTSNGLPPALLQLEITESCLLDGGRTNAREIIVALRELGVGVHLDDFGTGYSSLARLAALPFDALKIDSTFTAAIPNDPRMRTMVTSIVAIAHALEMSVIAEGVETAVQRDMLLEMGCRLQQGYFFARPMSAEAVTLQFGGRVELAGG